MESKKQSPDHVHNLSLAYEGRGFSTKVVLEEYVLK